MITTFQLRVAGMLIATVVTGIAQPVITNQPQTQAVAPGETATFTVGASGTQPLTYQWQRNLGTDFANLPDATNATWVLTNAESWDAWDYRVVVSNSGGTTNSAGAHLYVMRFAPVSTNLFADNFDDNKLTGWNLLLPSSGAGGRLSETNGQFTVCCSWPGRRTIYPWDTLQEGYLNKNWSLAEGQTIEFRADLVAISEDTTNASVFEVVQDWEHSYTFGKGRDWIRMGKYASGTSIPFWCERAAVRNTNSVLAFALTKATPNVILTGRVLDKANPNVVLYQHSFVDTPGVDPTFTQAQVKELSDWDFVQGPDVAGAPYTSGGMVSIGFGQYTDGHQPAAQITYDNFEVRKYARVFTRYVDASSANPTPPYTNWVTAATNIQDAVDTAESGDVVVVTNGVYAVGGWTNQYGTGKSRVTITNSIRLESVNGPLVTTIEGSREGQWIRCMNLCAEVVVSGFTFSKGGAFGEGGGVDGYESLGKGVVTNCILTDNWSGLIGGGACAVRMYNCTLTGNSAPSGGGAYGSALYNSTLTENLAVNDYGWWGFGGGAADSDLCNCTVVDNFASVSGGGVVNSTLLNCIVGYNAAWIDPNYSQCDQYYCCTSPLPTNGIGNISVPPQFVDYAIGNLRLQSNSPCINAGNNAYATSTTDLEGNPRIVRGTVDIGAYEFQKATSEISYAWLQSHGLPTDGSADFGDPDHDGLNTWQEWLCQTDPTNALSVLRLLAASSDGTNVRVTWQSVAGVNYLLERSTNFSVAPAFGLLTTNFPGQPGTSIYTDTNAARLSPLFYRVGVGN